MYSSFNDILDIFLNGYNKSKTHKNSFKTRFQSSEIHSKSSLFTLPKMYSTF